MDYDEMRERMVHHQIRSRGIDDPALLEAMQRVPRERFVEARFRPLAYRDGPLPIGDGQTISQPYVVAVMTEALEVKPGDKVLEVGTGSGYQAAVLAEMGARVVTVERYDRLAGRARDLLEDLGYHSVQVIAGDGSRGFRNEAPYDGILVTAAGPTIPTELLEQLRPGAHLVIPVDQSRGRQKLTRITRRTDGHFDRSDLGEVAFVPLIGRGGWPQEGAGGWR